MATLEQKCDTMVSIINDIAKELTSVKQVTTNYMMTSAMSSFHIPPPFHGSHTNHADIKLVDEEDVDVDIDHNDDNDDDGDDDNVIVNEENDDDTDVCYESDYEVDEVNETDKHSVEEYHKIVVSDTEMDCNKEDVVLKVVHLDTEVPELTINNDQEDMKTEDSMCNEDIKDEDYKVKIYHDNEQEIDYRKMTPTHLRTIVQSKGLVADSSKMKKHELIQLLQKAV
jgi:hypothetical protein